MSDQTTALVDLEPRTTMDFGTRPTSLHDAITMAERYAKSQMVPKAYQGHPEDILVAMQYGLEVGLPPMAALQSIAVINGKPGLYGDGFLGVIMGSAAYHRHVEYFQLANGDKVGNLRVGDLSHDETCAVTEFWRKGNPDPFVGTFSIADAKRAKLWGKDGPWSTYTARQMKWRARGYAGRDGFAAELRGLRIVEELADIDPIETTVLDDQPPTPPVRRSEKMAPIITTTTSPVHPPTPPTPPPPTTPTPKPTPATPPAPKPTPKGTDVLDSLAIIGTDYITPKDEAPYYEIRAKVSPVPDDADGTAFVFFTRDQTLYELAASAEDTDQTFKVTWHPRKKKDGTTGKEIDGLAAAD